MRHRHSIETSNGGVATVTDDRPGRRRSPIGELDQSWLGRDVRMRGTISSAAFASGDRFVVGAWHTSPVGEFADVMWAAPDGTRTLLAPSREVARWVTGIYAFDRVVVTPISWTAAPRRLRLTTPQLDLRMLARGGVRAALPRPWWATRRLEGPLAGALMGVVTHGHSPTGVQEWYQARSWRWVHRASASLHGRDLGAVGPLDPPLRVGFSEPPPRPSIVDVAVRLRWPAGTESPPG